MTEETCIWCGGSPAASLEHIAPDALGCPEDFVLTKGVCSRCNHRNGRLDRALLTPFEIMTVPKGVPRKRGKKPTIDGSASIFSDYDENGPVIYMNHETIPIDLPNGKRLSGVNAANPIRNFEMENQNDGKVKLSYDQELRFDRKAVRGLFRIAVETVAFFEGLSAARAPDLTSARRFVTDGVGNF